MVVVMETYITEKLRVNIEHDKTAQGNETPFTIQTEQKATGTTLPWENRNGWRMCSAEYAYTIEDAVEKYKKRIESERRWIN